MRSPVHNHRYPGQPVACARHYDASMPSSAATGKLARDALARSLNQSGPVSNPACCTRRLLNRPGRPPGYFRAGSVVRLRPSPAQVYPHARTALCLADCRMSNHREPRTEARASDLARALEPNEAYAVTIAVPVQWRLGQPVRCGYHDIVSGRCPPPIRR